MPAKARKRYSTMRFKYQVLKSVEHILATVVGETMFVKTLVPAYFIR
jgi:hypothetical protein